MYKLAHPARKRSARKQRRLTWLRARRPTIQQMKVRRDEWKRMIKEEERAWERRAYPGLDAIMRETFREAANQSAQTGQPTVDRLWLLCRGMERYRTGAYAGSLVQSGLLSGGRPRSTGNLQS